MCAAALRTSVVTSQMKNASSISAITPTPSATAMRPASGVSATSIAPTIPTKRPPPTAATVTIIPIAISHTTRLTTGWAVCRSFAATSDSI